MKYKNLIKSNLKFIIAMTVVIALGAVGITFAINIDTFNPIGINIGTATLGANITYLTGSSATITSTGKLLPINDDKTEITPDSTNESILKIDFKVIKESNFNFCYPVCLNFKKILSFLRIIEVFIYMT